MLAPNTLLQNRYLIVRSIGHGGMGAVYLARDERLSNTVALKETFFTDERLRKAFEREARLLAHLRHPALPKVTDHFDEDGGQFIVMEFISGDDLEILLAQRGRAFPVEQVLAWGDELLKALDYLHKQDPPILHRDIKPANLKLTPEGEIILLDFGLAKGTAGQTSSVMTSKSIFGFTPNFAPLEQIQGTGTGPRSDLYSLAATLYYLMTCVIPPDALTRITEVANGQPDPLRRPDEVNPQIPTAVADILMKTMAHNRDQRPASAALMRRMLREVSPPPASFIAFEEKADGNEARSGLADKQTILPSTLIEPLSTQETPAAVETSPSTLPSTAGSPISKLETAPVGVTSPASKIERKSLRLPWAIAGFVVLLLIGVTIGLVSNYNSDKAAADQASKAATKDAVSTGEPAAVIPQQTVATPDDPKVNAQIAEQKGLPQVKAPVKAPVRKTSPSAKPAGSKTFTPNQAVPNQSEGLQSTEQKNLESKESNMQKVSPKTQRDFPQSRAQNPLPN
jgi:serine/threonine protein kinase